jgi:hypothetical protein
VHRQNEAKAVSSFPASSHPIPGPHSQRLIYLFRLRAELRLSLPFLTQQMFLTALHLRFGIVLYENSSSMGWQISDKREGSSERMNNIFRRALHSPFRNLM